jgi:hypothetical protein
VTPVEIGLVVVVLGAPVSALDAGLASPPPLKRPPQFAVGVASSVPVSIGVSTLGGSYAPLIPGSGPQFALIQGCCILINLDGSNMTGWHGSSWYIAFAAFMGLSGQ